MASYLLAGIMWILNYTVSQIINFYKTLLIEQNLLLRFVTIDIILFNLKIHTRTTKWQFYF